MDPSFKVNLCNIYGINQWEEISCWHDTTLNKLGEVVFALALNVEERDLSQEGEQMTVLEDVEYQQLMFLLFLSCHCVSMTSVVSSTTEHLLILIINTPFIEMCFPSMMFSLGLGM